MPIFGLQQNCLMMDSVKSGLVDWYLTFIGHLQCDKRKKETAHGNDKISIGYSISIYACLRKKGCYCIPDVQSRISYIYR